MAVSIVNRTSAAGAATVTKPASGANGDVYVVGCQEFNGSSDHTAPSGFTQIGTMVTQTDVTLSLWFRIHNGGEGATFVVGSAAAGSSNMGCWLLTGVHATTPVLAGTVTGRTGTNHVTAAIDTTGVDGCMLLTLFGTHVTTTKPTGMTTGWSIDGNDFVGSDVIQATGGSVSKQATNASSNGVNAIIAIQPPAAAATVIPPHMVFARQAVHRSASR